MKLYNDDCLQILKTLENESIDLIVTDCPYHIVSGGCTTGAYGNPSGMLSHEYKPKKRVGYRKDGGYYLEGTKHIALGGILDDNDITYTRQGKIFKHNDIKFSEWLPELYRVLKPNKHIYIYIYKRKKFKKPTTRRRKCWI